MNNNKAIFFLSTGRCGTQSITHVLDKLCGDRAVVEHEPLTYEYRPNKYFRCKPRLYAEKPNEVVDKHLANIKEILRTKYYIETGWLSYSHIPYFINALGSRVQVIHLVRHPLKVAASLMTHKYFKEDNDQGFNVYGTISPDNHGAALKEYKNRWKKMSRFEKCLYHWAEINNYGMWLHEKYPNTPFLQINAEDLFNDPTSKYGVIMDFMGLDWSGDLNVEESRVDNYSMKTKESFNPELISRHPEIIQIAKRFSYSEMRLPATSIKRYKRDRKLIRWLKNMFRLNTD